MWELPVLVGLEAHLENREGTENRVLQAETAALAFLEETIQSICHLMGGAESVSVILA